MYDEDSNSLRVNGQLIKYIFDTIDIQKYKYEIIASQNDLEKISLNKISFVSPNFIGKNCFLVFTKLGSNFYSFIVDKKQLSYSFDKLNFSKIDVIQCNALVDTQLFDGTIFDGIYYTKNNINHKYIISDVYQFRGNDYSNIRIDLKLYEINEYLNAIKNIHNNYQKSFNTNISIELTVNNIRKIAFIEDIVAEINTPVNGVQIRGLCFYPEKSSIKLLFMFNKTPVHKNNIQQIVNPCVNTIVTKKTQEIKHSKCTQHSVFIAKSEDPIYAILEMKPTDTVDIYNLYAVEKVHVNGETKLRKKKMDIAFIPSIDKSIWCRKIITESPSSTVFVKCIWRNNKNKWEPIELNTKVKLPCLIDDIMKDFVEIIESDSDSDNEA